MFFITSNNSCSAASQTKLDSNILDKFVVDRVVATLRRLSDSNLQVQWTSSGTEKIGWLKLFPPLVRGNNRTEVALMDENTGTSFDSITMLNSSYMITSAMMESPDSSTTLVLYAGRYFLKVPLELNKTIELEVENMAEIFCPDIKQSTANSTIYSPTTSNAFSIDDLWTFIFMLIFVVVFAALLLALILLIYWGTRSEEKAEQLAVNLAKSSSTEKSSLKLSKESETKSFDPKSSSVQYNKPIATNSDSNKSEDTYERPNELIVNP